MSKERRQPGLHKRRAVGKENVAARGVELLADIGNAGTGFQSE
jgi:hypothetical protein